jgi:toxin-antitoxin system PIN domain toxin
MILIDANLLIYAYDSGSENHEAARQWLEHTFSAPEPIRLAWVTLLAFLRITTNPRLGRPLALAEAVSIVDDWLERPNVGLLAPGERHWEILRTLTPKSQARGNLVMDAHLAALAIEHGATLHTTDRDFSRFAGLRFSNPIAPK